MHKTCAKCVVFDGIRAFSTKKASIMQKNVENDFIM